MNTANGPAQSRQRAIYALGQLEPASGIIAVSALPGERLMKLDPDVVENEHVPANGILGLLASFDIGKAQLAALVQKRKLAEKSRLLQIQTAEAQKSQAEATLAQSQAKLKELELQAGKFQPLRTASQLAMDEYTQLEAFRAEDSEFVTEHQLKKRENEMQQALADYTIANESYDSAKKAAEKTVAAAQANIDVANLTIKQLDQKLEQKAIAQEMKVAEVTLRRSVLMAPNVSPETLQNVLKVDAVDDPEPTDAEDRNPLTVLKVFLRPGEFVTQMPIMQLGDLSEMVCVAEVYEADVKDLHVGQAAVIRSPAFSGVYADGIDPETNERTGGMAGRIERIGGIIGSPGLSNRNPLAPADRSVVEVKVKITEPAAVAEAARRVGLQVTVEFDEPAAEDPKENTDNANP